MGSGSDVAKSASGQPPIRIACDLLLADSSPRSLCPVSADIVLADDNFASIVAAIEEGRRLFDNIQKFVLHLLATNIVQVVVLLLGLILKDRNGVSILPLSPRASSASWKILEGCEGS